MASIVKQVMDAPEGNVRDLVDLDELQDILDQVDDWNEASPEVFSVQEVNQLLQALQNHWATR